MQSYWSIIPVLLHVSAISTQHLKQINVFFLIIKTIFVFKGIWKKIVMKRHPHFCGTPVWLFVLSSF